MPSACMYWKTLAEASAILILAFKSRSTYCFFMCKRLNRLPCATCSNTITMLGILGMTPIRRAIFGCLRIAYMTISF
jgi:hypothetical protein